MTTEDRRFHEQVYQGQMRAWELDILKHNELLTAEHKSIFDFGMLALKGITLINGGAAIAILAYLGQLAGKGLPVATGIKPAMIAFMLGTGSGVTGAALAYFAQYFYVSDWRWTGRGFHIMALLVAILGLLSFFYGGCAAVDALTSPPPPCSTSILGGGLGT